MIEDGTAETSKTAENTAQGGCFGGWAVTPEDRLYHDTRWGRPEHDDRELFAMLCLEGQQCGLSWHLILKREAAIRKAFYQFDYEKLARLSEEETDAILEAPGIIRNKSKVRAAVKNAKAFLEVRKEFGSFDRYIWSFTDGRVIDHHLTRTEDIPASDELSEKVSKDLKKRGFSYIGPVIVYSYLEGIGVINDHLDGCPFKYR
ncbi:MAG: DNA-3-methyladenine glycosylase I [Lachnospiraceae bacterium]